MSSRRRSNTSSVPFGFSRLAFAFLFAFALTLTGFSIGAATSHFTDNRDVPATETTHEATQSGLTAISGEASFSASVRDAGSKLATTTTANPVEEAEPSRATTQKESASNAELPSAGSPGTDRPTAAPQIFVPAPRPIAPAPAPQPVPAAPRAEPKIDFAPLPPPAYELDGGAVRFN